MNKQFGTIKRFVALAIAVFCGMEMPMSYATPSLREEGVPCSALNTPDGAINGVFSVSPTQRVYFSMGNLQYQSSTDTWRFAPNQYDFVGLLNNSISSTNEEWMDLFGWGTSGYNHGAVCYQPWATTPRDEFYKAYGATMTNLYDQTGQAEWGYNIISNGGEENGLWRTLSKEEWNYVLNTRVTVSGLRYAKATVDNVKGLILLPDHWRTSTYVLLSPNVPAALYDVNVISATDWQILQNAGAVFLPAAGSRYDKIVKGYSTTTSQYASGYYWTGEHQDFDGAYVFHFIKSGIMPSYTHYRYVGLSVRLVQPVTTLSVSADASSTEGGTVTIDADTISNKDYEYGDTCVLRASAAFGYTFINWTLEDGTVVSWDPVYTFTVLNSDCYRATFVQGEVQFYDLLQGYNWMSTYIEQEGIDGLGVLQNSLGHSGLLIKSQNDGFNSYLSGFGWYGTITSINNESMYIVKTAEVGRAYQYGEMASVSSHPITLNPGMTWIGYPSTVPLSLDDAFSNVNPKTGDLLKSQHEGFSSYLEGYGWYGMMNTISPGAGYVYKSFNTNPVTFVYPEAPTRGELKANLSTKDYHWQPNWAAYPDNMTLTAVVELDGEELQDERFELAAFANGECRGSVRLLYVEPLQRHVAFLTISGEESTELHFGLYDTKTGKEWFAEEGDTYEANADRGSLLSPFKLTFNTQSGTDVTSHLLQVYPNPVNNGAMLSLDLSSEETGTVQVKILNSLGSVVAMQTYDRLPAEITAPDVPGVYMLNFVIEGKGCYCRKLVVK